MPSDSKTRASSSPASGSSNDTSRPSASTTVTCAPNLAKTWASSTPMAPPPSTISESGTSVALIASRLVQNGVPASPGTGGTAGAVPVLITMPRLARSRSGPSCSPPVLVTSTSPAAVIRPVPRNR